MKITFFVFLVVSVTVSFMDAGNFTVLPSFKNSILRPISSALPYKAYEPTGKLSDELKSYADLVNQQENIIAEIMEYQTKHEKETQEYFEKVEKLAKNQREDVRGWSSVYDRSENETTFFHTCSVDTISAYANLCGDIYSLNKNSQTGWNIFSNSSAATPAVVDKELTDEDRMVSVLTLLKNDLLKCKVSLTCHSEISAKVQVLFKHEAKIDSPEALYDFLEKKLKFYSEKLAIINAKLAREKDPLINKAKALASITTSFPDYEVIKIFKRNKDQISGLMLSRFRKAEKELHLIMVFVGAQSVEDWIDTFKISQSVGIVGTGIGQGLSVHSGVLNALNQGLLDFPDFIKSYINDFDFDESNLKIRFTTTGHGLGGAISTLAAYHIKIKISQLFEKCSFSVENVSFGSPKFLSPESAKIVDSVLKPAQIMRIYNQWDTVAMYPNNIFFAHAGTPVDIPDRFDENYKLTYKQHTIENYANKVAGGLKSLYKEVNEKNNIKNMKKNSSLFRPTEAEIQKHDLLLHKFDELEFEINKKFGDKKGVLQVQLESTLPKMVFRKTKVSIPTSAGNVKYYLLNASEGIEFLAANRAKKDLAQRSFFTVQDEKSLDQRIEDAVLPESILGQSDLNSSILIQNQLEVD